jgi:hypothetical protein
MIITNKINFDKWKNVNQRDDVLELRELITNSFKDLVFVEDGHKYFLHGKELTSVSKVVEAFVPEFNTDAMAQMCFEKYYNTSDHKYYQMTKNDILNQWDKINKDACDLGHNKHDYGENLFYLYTGQHEKINFEWNIDSPPSPDDFMNYNVWTFWNDLPVEYIPIQCETKVYDESKGYSGTFDILFAWDNGIKPLKENLIIPDYKTNNDLFKNFNEQKMLPPFEDLLNTNYNHYAVQLSLYQIPLENIGCKIIDRRIIYLNNPETYVMYRLDNHTQKLREIL